MLSSSAAFIYLFVFYFNLPCRTCFFQSSCFPINQQHCIVLPAQSLCPISRDTYLCSAQFSTLLTQTYSQVLPPAPWYPSVNLRGGTAQKTVMLTFKAWEPQISLYSWVRGVIQWQNISNFIKIRPEVLSLKHTDIKRDECDLLNVNVFMRMFQRMSD